MIAVVKGDIIGSRKLNDPEQWIVPLRKLLNQWGNEPKNWELIWGDYFELEVKNPEEALEKSTAIKALIKSIDAKDQTRKKGTIDVRISIGIGDKSYTGKKISESNGSAFMHAGDQFDLLKKEKLNLAIRSGDSTFDKEINLYLKLASTFMDAWSISSAQMAAAHLKYPKATQAELGKMLGIKQNSVSGRWSRSNIDHFKELNQMYKFKLNNILAK